ncbi:hypothetical protein D6D10_08130 [Aureobasidium pullulans]|uniref:Uncharacterized protein n=1 Tax=Aureobasidium pullulans TaxID=5580 RepID=A0A4S9EGI3_AURPU|nr:hypothetical protein D6D10_08130 [Aureobasidium pullulans]
MAIHYPSLGLIQGTRNCVPLEWEHASGTTKEEILHDDSSTFFHQHPMNNSNIMPLDLVVKGEGSASRLANVVKIVTTFRSEGLYRKEASTTLFEAVQQLTDTLNKISPRSDSGHSVFQATSDGPITSWKIGSLHCQTETVRLPSTSVVQETHTITTSCSITVHHLPILEQVGNAIVRLPCVSSVNTLWSLDDLANVRLKVEVHELAAKDALNKATAIASSIGFTKVVAKTVELKDSIKVAINSSSLFEETSQRAHAYQSGRRFVDGCLLEDDEEVVPTSIRGDGKWTGCDDAGHLDVWRLVFAPKTITMHAKVEAKFSAISSTGWVYEEFNEHRFITS